MNSFTDKAPAQPARRRLRKLVVALAVAVVAVCMIAAAFLVYAGDVYEDADVEHRNLVSTSELPVEQGTNFVAFGDPDARTGVVFYPGAKVAYTSYAPLMRNLAERGYLAVVVEMPFNFAFFNIDAADEIRTSFPKVGTWWVGGHSLGGSMAAQYAANNARDPVLAGIVLLGSYSASDLSDADMGALVLYGSNDQVLNRTKLAESEQNLPSDSLTVELEGGNHAFFGSYGQQEGDGIASIAPSEQQAETADAIDAFIRENDRGAAPETERAATAAAA